ncbi:MAG TPA: DEAD/DEAH box helicase, partial [Terriglobales bacterium]|nr:DEAD/DEAH box helicase [Terriglobales bacterium]
MGESLAVRRQEDGGDKVENAGNAWLKPSLYKDEETPAPLEPKGAARAAVEIRRSTEKRTSAPLKPKGAAPDEQQNHQSPPVRRNPNGEIVHKTAEEGIGLRPSLYKSAAITRVREVLEGLEARDREGEVLTAVRHFPAREAEWADFPEWVSEDLRAAYAAKGIRRLYSHQALAAEEVHAGKNVVVVTPTASGKTLCYNLAVLDAVLKNADTRALYLFPTKALAQDQLAELYDLNQRLENRFGVFTYDGDTPGDARKAIREKGHIVLANPDMLHTGILPHHTRWTRLFENLKYIVIDELHTYRGVFGSHLCNVL